MRIAEFSQRLGISTDSVRWLEARGRLPGRRDWAGHRRYNEEDVRRARILLGLASETEDAPGDDAT